MHCRCPVRENLFVYVTSNHFSYKNLVCISKLYRLFLILKLLITLPCSHVTSLFDLHKLVKLFYVFNWYPRTNLWSCDIYYSICKHKQYIDNYDNFFHLFYKGQLGVYCTSSMVIYNRFKLKESKKEYTIVWYK